MKIIIHHRTQGRGVEAVHLMGISEGFSSIGHKVKIVSPIGVNLITEEDSKNDSKRLSIFSLISKYAPEILFEIMEIFNNLFASKLLEDQKKRFGCDILYERFALLNFIGGIKAKMWNVKFVVEVNYTTNSSLDIRKRSQIFSNLAKKFERFTFNKADLLLPVSSTLADELLNKGYPEKKVLISPNAVNPEIFKPSIPDHHLRDTLDLEEGSTIGYVGGFAPWHGLENLIESVGMIKNGKKKINLLLIGDGPKMKDILKLRKRYKNEINIILPGKIQHSNIPRYLALIDILVMPNSNDYGSPMKVFEYMAMAKAVVAPDYPPLRDVISDGFDGLLFKPNDPKNLTKILEKLTFDKKLMEELGKNARRKVVDIHNWKNRVLKICERISSIEKS